MDPLIAGICLVVFVGVAFGVIAFTGRRRVQVAVLALATVALLAAAVASRFW